MSKLKLERREIHVLSRLANITKLLMMRMTATKKSIAMTKETKMIAVCNGVVKWNLWK